jgi:hypothetical protein
MTRAPHITCAGGQRLGCTRLALVAVQPGSWKSVTTAAAQGSALRFARPAVLSGTCTCHTLRSLLCFALCCVCVVKAGEGAEANTGVVCFLCGVCSGPSEDELRSALEALLEGVDMTAVSYSQVHKQLEAKFKVRCTAGHLCAPTDQSVSRSASHK